MLAFVHYKNTPNIGDLMCAPYHYFNFADAQSFDLSDEIPPCDAVIYGGGAIEPKLRTERIQDGVQAARKIAWGIGTSRRGKTTHGPLLDDLDLCGVRELGREVGVKNAFYVPCVSCMSPLFDKTFPITQEVVFYTHGVFSLPDTGEAPRATNRSATLEEALRFIASGETVVTNSFHGTYWATLLGRKVVCLPFSSKFYGYKYPPTYCTDNNFEIAIKGARSYPEALEDARKHNIAFYERVRNMLSELPATRTAVAVGSRKASQRVRSNPYAGIERRAHWRRAVVGRAPTEITDWYRKKFDITNMRIATAGSCFAQHIGKRLRESGFQFVDAERAPSVMLPAARADFGYDLYSARFGNIYTTRQLLQLIQRATGEFQPAELFWRKDDGFVDPFRPAIEPVPYETKEAVSAARVYHLKRVRHMMRGTDLFVFTLGLTEAWQSLKDGAVFPLAPGVHGGKYDPRKHALLNLTYEDVTSDLQQVIDRLREINPNMHFLLTVSPVPLMATATDQHVVVATGHSKAILRAAAGHFAAKYDYLDYFPSFEIVNSHVTKGQFYEEDGRGVLSTGVDFVMSQFFSQHIQPEKPVARKRGAGGNERIVCEEEILASFGAAS